MDTKDNLFFSARYGIGIERITAATDHATIMAGKPIPAHNPGLECFAFIREKGSGTAASPLTTVLLASYPPSTLAAAQLSTIRISELKIHTHHRGKRLVVRVTTPPKRAVGVLVIIEDEHEGETLLNYMQPAGQKFVSSDEILRKGGIFLVKEPFSTRYIDGSFVVRVDHVSDIIHLADDDQLVPLKWRKDKPTTDNTPDATQQAEVCIRTGNWAGAERFYTLAFRIAQTAEDRQTMLFKRSGVNRLLGRPTAALWDAQHGGGSKTTVPTPQGLLLEAGMLYHLGDFNKCLLTCETLMGLNPSAVQRTQAMSKIDSAKARIQESQEGRYDFHRMYKQAKATPPLVDCATYSAPVEVRDSPGRARGLYTTCKVQAGELLVCEKAFAYSFVDDPPRHSRALLNFEAQTIYEGGQAVLLNQIVQKLYDNPQAASSFSEIWHGNYQAVPADIVDGKPIVDTFLVDKVINLSSAGAPRRSRDVHVKFLDEDNEQPLATLWSKFGTVGIWPLISRINHLCIANCHRSFIGDMQIIRASKDLDADTELSFAYEAPHPFAHYDETQQRLSRWDFKCACTLCLQRKFERGTNRLAKRQTKYRQLMVALGSKPTDANPNQCEELLRLLQKTYKLSAQRPGAVRLEVAFACFPLAEVHRCRNNPLAAVEFWVQALEAMGYIMTARPPRVDLELPEFSVQQWGMAHHLAVRAFLDISQAYKNHRLLPELCTAARSCAEKAYAMVVGETDTFEETHPEPQWDAWVAASDALANAAPGADGTDGADGTVGVNGPNGSTGNL